MYVLVASDKAVSGTEIPAFMEFVVCNQRFGGKILAFMKEDHTRNQRFAVSLYNDMIKMIFPKIANVMVVKVISRENADN